MNNSVSGNSLKEPIFAVNNNHSNRTHFAITGDWAYDGGDWGRQAYKYMKIKTITVSQLSRKDHRLQRPS